MNRSDLIDPEARVPLEALLQAMPGGFNLIPDIVARRSVVESIFAGLEVPDDPNVTKNDQVVPGTDGEPDITVVSTGR